MLKNKLIPIIVALLLVPSISLAQNTTKPVGDSEDTSIPYLSVISPTDYFKVESKNIQEKENSYRINGTIKAEWTKCNSCIRQIILSIDETNKTVKCIYNGIPGKNNPKKINFDVEIDKNKIEGILEKSGEANLIASKHSGWNCGWVMNKFPKEVEGILVHKFETSSMFGIFTILPLILLVLLISFGYLIYKKWR